eukprot:CAMPEP_0115285648 /NCGR_PEP_ID=MMETSP0270-20121206/61539_1 /TAXON_ID=71861 /ORGANISM="Scrippsiella trochoidea, Strain CCMP3099" /LENGTH=113 /DNA_ID=CAMNT_0002702677 /DNA_START=57 /DNA_END=395 /DNA_ORIENTATION=+
MVDIKACKTQIRIRQPEVAVSFNALSRFQIPGDRRRHALAHMSDNHGAQQLRQKELDSSAWGDHLCTYQELEKCKTEQTFRADSNLQLHHTASEFLKNPPSQKPMNLPYPVSS